MGGRTQEVLLTLKRNSPTEPWGFSLVGGADLKTPLIVTRVSLFPFHVNTRYLSYGFVYYYDYINIYNLLRCECYDSVEEPVAKLHGEF